MLEKKLVEILACPKCKRDLDYDSAANTLTCPDCRLIYRVEDDIPIMLIDEAQSF